MSTQYLTAQHLKAPRHVGQGGMLHPTAPLISTNDTARLVELGIYRHVTEDGDAPLGYSTWTAQSDDDGTYYARTRLGTDAQRDAVVLRGQWAEQAQVRKLRNAERTLADHVDDERTQASIDALKTITGAR